MSDYVAEVATRLHERLADVASDIRRFLDDHIPELRRRSDRGAARPASEATSTMLHALRYDIAVERVEAPTAALEYAPACPTRGARPSVGGARLPARPAPDE